MPFHFLIPSVISSNKPTIVIGAGFAGLSAACFLAKGGADVIVLEKQPTPGGRAAQLKKAGFTFDMGPSWYWMPDVFDRFFECFGKKTSDYYKLTRLDPSYRVYWPDGFTDLPANMQSLENLFESMEPGSAARLRQFLKEAEYKYRVGMQKLVHKPGLSVMEFLDMDVIRGAFQLDLLTSMEKHVDGLFKHPRLREILKFPVLFLGALPRDTPALYSLMNYADLVGGTWYPEGGMYSIVKAMYNLAIELGVQFHFNEPVTAITVKGNRIDKVITPLASYAPDNVVGAADYHHIETALLPSAYRSYSDAYWNSRSMAPGCLLYYIGLNKKIPGLQHHSLFFDTDFARHGAEIYDDPRWPANPLFYVCASSVTDPDCAPEGHENLFFLVPVAAGLSDDTEQRRAHYFNIIWKRFRERFDEVSEDAIVFRGSFGYSDFTGAYNSFKGNAYGLANTLKQTAVFKPSCRSKKVSNLFYTGQLTVPGPGVPPSLISGEVVAKEVKKSYRKDV
ncbi:MAG: phytoene desaturase [Chitinophagaceae bacterium]|nr:MAG: phytoene desaturase [Chitinophagaceae bacterium]